MGRLDHLSLDELHEQLEHTEGNIPTQRILAAIGRTQGASLAALAERHNVSEKTIRNWLDRFGDRPLAEAPYDRTRSGRPPRLSKDLRLSFVDDLRESPEEFEYDRDAWTVRLARYHLEKEYDVGYSIRHVYRLLDEVEET